MSEHALLSASGAERWVNCPPSARLEETFPDESSGYADDGTLAHSLAELKARKHFLNMPQSGYVAALKEIKANPLYTLEMEDVTEEYLLFLKGISMRYPKQPHVALEQKVFYDDVAPEGFGTADCVMISGADIHVVDFKFGKGVRVDAAENLQELLYAHGAVRKYAPLFAIENVNTHIVQPRICAPSSWALSKEELEMRMDYLRPIAEKAYRGEGEFAAGDHCRFCRARRRCAARTAFCMELEPLTEKKPALLSIAEIGAALSRVEVVQSWLTDVQNYITSQLLDGVEVPGWKLVEGRATRVWADQEKAFDILKTNGYDESILYERIALSLAKIETSVGKKKFNDLVSGLIVKTPGKPTLVAESDPREVFKPKSKADAFSENRPKCETEPKIEM